MRLPIVLLLALAALLLLCKIECVHAATEEELEEFAFEDDVEEDEEEASGFDEGSDGLPGVSGDDEFDDADFATDKAAEPAAATKKPSVAAPVPIDAPSGPRTYELEIVAGVVTAAYIIMYFAGRRTNEQIAQAWMSEFSQLFSEQFAQCGVGATWGPMMKDSQSTFKYFCAGRRYCSGMMATLEMKQRHDLLSVLWGLVSPSQDTLTLEFPMEDMPPLVLAVVRKKDRAAIHRDSVDLANYAVLANPTQPPVVPDDFDLLVEAKSVVPDVLTRPIAQVLLKHHALLNMIHITDEAPLSDIGTAQLSKNVLRLQFLLPPASHMAYLQQLMQIAFHMVDTVATVRLSDSAEKLIKSHRASRDQAKSKESQEDLQERIARRKAEQAAKEREHMRSLSREQQRKLDEKNRKKDLRKRANRMKVRMG